MKQKSLLFFFLRFCLYFAAMILLNQVFMYDATHPTATEKFGEISLTERIQAVLLFILFMGFFFVGRKTPPLRHMSYLIALFFLMSFVREFNEFIDKWFYIVLPIFIASVLFLVLYFKKIIDGLNIFIRTTSSSLFMVGFLITYVFSRFFGREKFWEALMEEGYMRMAKATAEEGTELLGYTFLIIALIELMVSIPKLLNEVKQ